eukprot:g78328.t1
MVAYMAFHDDWICDTARDLGCLSCLTVGRGVWSQVPTGAARRVSDHVLVGVGGEIGGVLGNWCCVYHFSRADESLFNYGREHSGSYAPLSS